MNVRFQFRSARAWLALFLLAGWARASVANEEGAVAPRLKISGWRLVELDKLDPGSRHNVEFSFFLDNSQLPQPMQIDLGGDWKLGIERNLRVE